MEAICAGLNVLELGSGSAAASIAGVVLADAGEYFWATCASFLASCPQGWQHWR